MTIPEKAAVRDPYAVFKSHAHGVADDTNVVIQEALREAHPRERLTAFDTERCDLEKWAEAGHATISSLEPDGRYPKLCQYTAPKSRMVEEDGSVKELSVFGHFALEYQGLKHHFYAAQWPHGLWAETRRYNFLLSPEVDPNERQIDGDKVHELVLAASRWTAELHNEIYVFDDGHWSKSSKLWDSVQTASWDEIILDPALKQTVPGDVRSFFDQRELYRAYGIPWKRGIILHGTPGCGKTASIRALMREMGQRRPKAVESLYVKSLDTCGRKPSWCVGQIFEKARKRAPCLLIFEDLDSLVVDQVRSFFLNEVDGVESNDGIFMIGSTNHLERLDPGISKRPSRFDRKYLYALPNERERVAYCEYWKQKLDTVGQVPFDSRISGIIADLTDGFSFAYLKELFVQSLFSLAVGGSEPDVQTNGDSHHVTQDETNGTSSDETTETTETAETEVKVTIPDDLQDNALLQMLMQQSAVLRKSMGSGTDVADGAEDKDGKEGKEGGENGAKESKGKKSCSCC